jgi:hypothetical protein
MRLDQTRYEARQWVPPYGASTFADGTVLGSSRFLVEYPLERYELYAHNYNIN